MAYQKLISSGINNLDLDVLKRMEKIGGDSYYLFDAERFSRNLSNLRSVLGPKVSLCYSVKANPWLAKQAAVDADAMEICSPGELKIALEEKWDLSRLTLDGLLKTEDEICICLTHGIGRISVDSLSQWRLIEKCARKTGRCASVLLRLTSGNQFGMEPEEIADIVKDAQGNDAVHVTGIHYYPGTQRKNAEEIKNQFQSLNVLLDTLEMRIGKQLDTIELGGGIPVPYFLEDSEEDYREAFEAVIGCVNVLSSRIPVIYEAGRILAASAGCYISKIIDCKYRSGKKIVIIEGGTHQLSYYGSISGFKTPKIHHIPADGHEPCAEERVTVCGSLCAAQDILAANAPLRSAMPGDHLVFGLAGAYSATECGNDFLCHGKPAILMRGMDGSIQVLRPKEDTGFVCL